MRFRRSDVATGVKVLLCAGVLLSAGQAGWSTRLVASSPARPGPHSVAGRRGYVVHPGDTLASIARRFGVSPVALAAANGLVDGRLYTGARLLVDVSPAGQPPSPATAWVAQAIHVVARGETLRSIARANGLTVAALAAANGLSQRASLRRGRSLVMPGGWLCPVAGHTTFMNDWGFPRAANTWHEGNDMFARRGTPVVAPVSGVVTPDANHLGGNAVLLHGDDGNSYYFAHLDHYGAFGRVKSGTVIGAVGNSGNANGGPTHLYFEIRPANGQVVDPFPTIRGVCR